MNPSSRPLTRRAMALGLAALGCALSAPAALAQGGFPSKPITFVVPYPAGGANDMLGRLIGQKMGEALGATVIIDNKPGAGAMLGANAVAKAAPDGHTVLVGGLATHAASPHLMKADYDPLKDFEAVGLLGQAPIVVITSNESPLRSLKDIAEIAKKKPGEMMYGSSGNGSPLHLAGGLFDAINGSQMTHVPYKGGNTAYTGMLGGEIDAMFDSMPAPAPHLQSGKIRAIGVTGGKRLPALPDVATLAEQGIAGVDVHFWWGFVGPAGLPKDVVAKLNAEISRALADPDLRATLAKWNIEPATGTPEAFGAYIAQESRRWREAVAAAGLALE